MTRNFTLVAAAGVFAIVLAFSVLLAASVALVFATLRIELIASPATHAAAAGAELIFGAVTLLAAVFVATQVAVRVFANGAAVAPTNSVKPTPESEALS